MGGAPGATVTADASSRPPGSPGGLAFLDAPFVLIINSAPNEYYFATNGSYPFRAALKNSSDIVAPASIDRGTFVNGKWVMSRRFNGDDIMGRGYDISAAAAEGQAGTQIPLGIRNRGASISETGVTTPPTIIRVRFYRYR